MSTAGPAYRGPLDNLFRTPVQRTYTDRQDSVTVSDFDSLFDEPRMGQKPSRTSKGKQPTIPARTSFRAVDVEPERAERERSLSPPSRPYQAAANRVNGKRDRDDGDYTPEKRARVENTAGAIRPTVGVDIEAESLWWQDRVQHQAFDKLKAHGEAKADRQRCIAEIEKLWDKLAVYCKDLPGAPRGTSKVFRGEAVLDMKDWSLTLLVEVRRLAIVTQKDWKKAEALLEDIVRRVRLVDADAQPKLCAKMVQIAIKIREAENVRSAPAKSTESTAKPDRHDAVSSPTFRASPTPGPSNSQPTPPQSPRSETMAPEVIDITPVTPAAPVVPNMQMFAPAAASLPTPEATNEERAALVQQIQDELADIQDSSDWYRKHLEANDIKERRLNRRLRNVGKGYALSSSQMPM